MDINKFSFLWCWDRNISSHWFQIFMSRQAQNGSFTIFFPLKMLSIFFYIFKLGAGNLPEMSRSWLAEQQADGLLFYQVHWDLNPCATAPLLWSYANISLIVLLLLYFPLRIQKPLGTGWIFILHYCHQIDLWEKENCKFFSTMCFTVILKWFRPSLVKE